MYAAAWISVHSIEREYESKVRAYRYHRRVASGEGIRNKVQTRKCGDQMLRQLVATTTTPFRGSQLSLSSLLIGW